MKEIDKRTKKRALLLLCTFSPPTPALSMSKYALTWTLSKCQLRFILPRPPVVSRQPPTRFSITLITRYTPTCLDCRLDFCARDTKLTFFPCLPINVNINLREVKKRSGFAAEQESEKMEKFNCKSSRPARCWACLRFSCNKRSEKLKMFTKKHWQMYQNAVKIPGKSSLFSKKIWAWFFKYFPCLSFNLSRQSLQFLYSTTKSYSNSHSRTRRTARKHRGSTVIQPINFQLLEYAEEFRSDRESRAFPLRKTRRKTSRNSFRLQMTRVRFVHVKVCARKKANPNYGNSRWLNSPYGLCSRPAIRLRCDGKCVGGNDNESFFVEICALTCFSRLSRRRCRHLASRSIPFYSPLNRPDYNLDFFIKSLRFTASPLSSPSPAH